MHLRTGRDIGAGTNQADRSVRAEVDRDLSETTEEGMLGNDVRCTTCGRTHDGDPDDDRAFDAHLG